MAGEDFVMVQLSKDGADAAGSSTLRVSNGRRSYAFKSGVAQRVERSYEWNAWLSRVVAPDGKKMFVLVPATAAPAPAAAAPAEEKK